MGDVEGGVGSWACGVLGGSDSALTRRVVARALSWEISERSEWHSWDLAVSWAARGLSELMLFDA